MPAALSVGMDTTPHFQQNPAGLNLQLTVVPGHITLSFNPGPIRQRKPAPDLCETVLILDGQCFILRGDFRSEYEQALATGGIETCIHLYLEKKPLFGSPWSSPRDPWQMIAGAYTKALRQESSARGQQAVRIEMALAE